jgi:hypothetical protein
VTCHTEGFSHFVTSMTAPVASAGAIWPGNDSHPLESAALSRRTRWADIADRRWTSRSPAVQLSLRNGKIATEAVVRYPGDRPPLREGFVFSDARDRA